ASYPPRPAPHRPPHALPTRRSSDLGSSIGTTAALVPLTIFIAPFMASLIEQSVLDVDSGIMEAAESMGATTWQTIRYFLLPEARSEEQRLNSSHVSISYAVFCWNKN